MSQVGQTYRANNPFSVYLNPAAAGPLRYFTFTSPLRKAYLTVKLSLPAITVKREEKRKKKEHRRNKISPRPKHASSSHLTPRPVHGNQRSRGCGIREGAYPYPYTSRSLHHIHTYIYIYIFFPSYDREPHPNPNPKPHNLKETPPLTLFSPTPPPFLLFRAH